MLLTRAPLYRGLLPFSLDLHVLGAPLTFVLSQDQTLQLNLEAIPEGIAAHSSRPGGRPEGSKWLRFVARRPRALRLLVRDQLWAPRLRTDPVERSIRDRTQFSSTEADFS